MVVPLGWPEVVKLTGWVVPDVRVRVATGAGERVLPWATEPDDGFIEREKSKAVGGVTAGQFVRLTVIE